MELVDQVTYTAGMDSSYFTEGPIVKADVWLSMMCPNVQRNQGQSFFSDIIFDENFRLRGVFGS